MFRIVLICTVYKIVRLKCHRQAETREGVAHDACQKKKIIYIYEKGFLMSATNSIYFPKAIGVEKNPFNTTCNTALECW